MMIPILRKVRVGIREDTSPFENCEKKTVHNLYELHASCIYLQLDSRRNLNDVAFKIFKRSSHLFIISKVIEKTEERNKGATYRWKAIEIISFAQLHRAQINPQTVVTKGREKKRSRDGVKKRLLTKLPFFPFLFSLSLSLSLSLSSNGECAEFRGNVPEQQIPRLPQRAIGTKLRC